MLGAVFQMARALDPGLKTGAPAPHPEAENAACDALWLALEGR